MESPPALDAIGGAIGQRTLIMGVARRTPAREVGEVERYFNSLVVLRSEAGTARAQAIYDKHRLTPFGEFIPLYDLVQGLGLRAIQQIGTGFTAGPPPYTIGVIPGAPPFSPLICYEALFPGLTPRGEERPGWIVNITNDAWFGPTTGPEQHWNQTRYRAIEEGLPIVRAASGGHSGVIDPYGVVVVAQDRKGGALEAALPKALAPTFYARTGNVFLLVFAIFMLAIGLSRRSEP
jgi:apolipoprotein N-acyltransferase